MYFTIATIESGKWGNEVAAVSQQVKGGFSSEYDIIIITIKMATFIVHFSLIVTDFKAINIFIQNNMVKFSNEAGQIGDLVPVKNTDKSKSWMYCGNYKGDGLTVCAIDMQKLIPTLTRHTPCAVFDVETDYPTKEIMTFGADGLGNHFGKTIFGRETYTSWLEVNKPYYPLPHSSTNDWEIYILCAVDKEI